MPSLYSDVFPRIKQVERECRAVQFAMDRLIETVRSDPTRLSREIAVRDVQAASDLLEDTYFVRLFAEFEHTLRDFWRVTRTTEPPIRDLIDSLGAMRMISNDWIAAVHDVRDYRNQLVHTGKKLLTIELATARQRICSYLSLFPPQW